MTNSLLFYFRLIFKPGRTANLKKRPVEAREVASDFPVGGITVRYIINALSLGIGWVANPSLPVGGELEKRSFSPRVEIRN